MKINPSANYYVQVHPHQWEVDAPNADLYTGVFGVSLNRVVRLAFVPDVSAVAPPWDFSSVPQYFDDITTVEGARLARVMVTPYVVTPNDAHAGTEEEFGAAATAGWRYDGVVFYVTAAEFARYAGQLDQLSEIVGGVQPKLRLAELRDYEVVDFVERRIVASGRLRPEDAAELAQTP